MLRTFVRKRWTRISEDGKSLATENAKIIFARCLAYVGVALDEVEIDVQFSACLIGFFSLVLAVFSY